MVYFTCNNCGDSLQKPKVQKHYQTACSRNPINLTCVDCHKDFGEKEYVAHVKCVTEMERYSDKSYVAKTNKGEAKQSSWIDAIQSVINESNARPAVKEVLQKLATFENVPRKKAKFFNFMKNCAVSRTKDDVLEEVWSLLEKQKDKIKKEPETNNKNSNEEVSEKLNGCEGEKIIKES
ncbi:cell growth-regulating nucleolar protein-like [Ctenocephalides felis]|uniref:cell growth-regulating nucleolar protein-like n=1 Tax=Ctenocephalides felis TaxID=7515 RepID=UPI000E6E1C2E|nr:cell growth-regulating nucleolar protein-like [Ctenocephalides felis]